MHFSVFIAKQLTIPFFSFIANFREWKEKYDLVDNDEDDTLTYHYKNTFIFRPDLSANVTGDEIIVIPHPCKSTFDSCWKINAN